jgi:hypothetical protein
MTSAYSENTQVEATKRSGLVRVLQSIGAMAVAAFALWFLFGIPAYLLFGALFE